MIKKPLLFITLVVLFTASSSFAVDRSDQPQKLNQFSEHYRAYDLEGVTQPNGDIFVAIKTTEGVVVFESRFVTKEDGRYIEWEWRGDPPYSMSRKVAPGTQRDVKGIATMSKDIVRAIKRGKVPVSTGNQVGSDKLTARIQPQDDFGCDWPFQELSCTGAGHCCDVHDACFDAYNCTALSWVGLESIVCSACNAVLVSCIANEATGLPSYCCYQNICGQHREPPYFGDISSGGLGGDGNDLQQVEPSGGGGGGGGWVWIGYTPWGSIGVGIGWCRFPDGTVIPCG